MSRPHFRLQEVQGAEGKMPRYTYQGGLILVCTLIWEGSKFSFLFFRERGREGGREREKHQCETSMCGCLSCAPYLGPGTQPSQVFRLGIQPAISPFCRQALSPLSHTARAQGSFKNKQVKMFVDHGASGLMQPGPLSGRGWQKGRPRRWSPGV